MNNFKNDIKQGDQIGDLTIITRVQNSAHDDAQFMCLCKCGKVVIRRATSLRYTVQRGYNCSCGCYRKKKNITIDNSPHLVIDLRCSKGTNKKQGDRVMELVLSMLIGLYLGILIDQVFRLWRENSAPKRRMKKLIKEMRKEHGKI